MKILLVFTTLCADETSYAGMEKIFTWLGNNLSRQGFDVTFCTIYDDQRCNNYNTDVKSIELGYPFYSSFLVRNIQFFIRVPFRIGRIIKENKFEVVISFGDMAFYPIFLLSLFGNFKFVVSERGAPDYNQSFYAFLKRKLYRFCNAIVFQTEGAKKCFADVTQKKSFVIPNPIIVPLEQWFNTCQNPSIVSVGRLDIWQKRQDVLIKAFEKVHREHSGVVLNLFGSGPDLDTLVILVERLGLNDCVHFCGKTYSVNTELLKNFIFVLSSDFEGIPNSLLEAMSIGMPVVSTRCNPGGAELLIDDGINGLLVECGDEQGIADAITRLLDNPKYASSLGKEARKSMNRFSPDLIISKWVKLLNEMVNSK